MSRRDVVELPSEQPSPRGNGPVVPKYNTSRLAQYPQMAPQPSTRAYEVPDNQQNYYYE